MFSAKRLILPLALSGCFFGGFGAIALAQSNPGLTLWSGVQRENILKYHLDFDGRPDNWDRYRLRIPKKKMVQGASRITITYPDYYKGKFDPDSIEVKYGSKYQNSAKISEVIWDKDNYLVQIDLEEPIEPDRKVEIKLSNVKNPNFGGTYYFHCQVLPTRDIPVPIYVGTWILSIGR